MELGLGEWLLFGFAALCIGLSKSGFSGVSIISVFILTELFGAKEQVGIGLPLLIAADLVVFPAFRKYGNWREVWILLPPALIGGAAGVWILESFNNEQMKPVVGGVIMLMLLMQLLKKWQPEKIYALAMTKQFSVFAGLSGGLATVLANAAGPIQQLYLLSKRMDKMDLIGVGARFFLLVNLLKLPIYSGMDIVSVDTLFLNLCVLPCILIGVLVGRRLLSLVPQKLFENLIVVFALVAALRLLFF